MTEMDFIEVQIFQNKQKREELKPYINNPIIKEQYMQLIHDCSVLFQELEKMYE